MYLLLLVTMMDSNDKVVKDSDDLTQDGDVMGDNDNHNFKAHSNAISMIRSFTGD